MSNDLNIHVDRKKCIACGRCVDRCIMDNLRLMTGPCRRACPLNLNPQGYITLAAGGEKEKAARLLSSQTPFASILGHICTAPCETACHRKRIDGGAVTIKGIESYLSLAYPHITNTIEIPQRKSGCSVRIIGAGPSGISAAYQALSSGHDVTLYTEGALPYGAFSQLINSGALPEKIFEETIDRFCSAGGKLRHQWENESAAAVIITTKSEDLLRFNITEPLDSLSIDPLTRMIKTCSGFFITDQTLDQKDTVIQAMAQGREAAISADRYLKGLPIAYDRNFKSRKGALSVYDPVKPEVSIMREEIPSIQKDTILIQNQVRNQAKRCLSCGRPSEKNETCWYCLPCEIECPVSAITVELPYLIR